jgi:hypothetical protein
MHLRDVHLSQLRIQCPAGGVIVCSGRHTIVTFTDVNFHGCTLLALKKAKVTIQRSRFENMATSSTGLSVYAHGVHTTVKVHECSMDGGVQGVTVQAGASFEANQLVVTNMDVAGLEVIDSGSYLALNDCSVQGVANIFQHTSARFGVHVHGNSSARIERCSIAGFLDGVTTEGAGSSLHAEGCILQQNENNGILAEGGEAMLISCGSFDNGMHGYCSRGTACMTLNSSSASGSVQMGFAALSGGKAVLKGCTAEKCKLFGVGAEGAGSALEAESCTFQGNTWGGVHATREAVVTINKCTVPRSDTEEGLYGYLSERRAVMKLSHSSVSYAKKIGFAAYTASKVTLKGCTVSKCQTHGVCAVGAGTRLEADGVSLYQNRECGILAAAEAVVDVTDSRSIDDGTQAYCSQQRARMTVTNSSASGAGKAGFAVVSGGKVTLKTCSSKTCTGSGIIVQGSGSRLVTDDCTIEENAEFGVLAARRADVVISNCRSSGNGNVGYCSVTKSILTVSNSSAEAEKRMGFAALSGSIASLKGCSASKCGVSGVSAEGAGSRLAIEDCTFTQNAECGVLANEHAVVVVKTSRSADNGLLGYGSQNRATMTITKSSATGNKKGGWDAFTWAKLSMQKVTVGDRDDLNPAGTSWIHLTGNES